MHFDIPPARVLVLVPSYNHERFLQARLDSVLGQTHKDFKLLVIDDASPDKSSSILERVNDPRARICIREKNTGTPFSAWRDVHEQADCEYLWIAESDDVAEPEFLARGLRALEENPAAAFYYTHSWIVDENTEICGHTINYLRRHFSVIDWERPQKLSGEHFNDAVQIYGNALPNMSSALMRMSAFRKAFDRSFDRFSLAADWVFAGRLAAQGEVLFSPRTDNNFRQHQTTSRVRTKLERTCAEYTRAISMIGDLPGVAQENLIASLERTAHMFLHERGSVLELARASLRFGPGHCLTLAGRVLSSLTERPDLRHRLREYLSVRRI